MTRIPIFRRQFRRARVTNVALGAFSTPVQEKASGAVATILTLTPTSAFTAGNSCIVMFTCIDTNGPTVSVAMVGGGAAALTRAETTTNTGILSEIWYVHNLAGGETAVRVTVTGSGRMTGNATEWTGLKNAAPEAHNQATGSSSSPATPSVSPTSANNLIIALGGWAVASGFSSGPLNGFTELTNGTNFVLSQGPAYIAQGSVSSKSTGWTIVSSAAWGAAIAAFGAN